MVEPSDMSTLQPFLFIYSCLKHKNGRLSSRVGDKWCVVKTHGLIYIFHVFICVLCNYILLLVTYYINLLFLGNANERSGFGMKRVENESRDRPGEPLEHPRNTQR